MSNKIIFFGNERLATGVSTNTPVVKALTKAGYDIAAIVITPQTSSISRKPRMLEIAAYATEQHIPLLEFTNLSEATSQLKQYQAQAGVLAAFGMLVPQCIIDVFPAGIVNIHPSLLPKHRGPTPIESPILQGETETGVSLMRLVKAMDAGPLFDQITVKLTGQETKQELTDQLSSLGAQRLVELLPDILSSKLLPSAQPEEGATYDQKIKPSDAILDFSKPAIQLEREVRAYAGWPKSKTTINNQSVVVTAAHVIDTEATQGEMYLQDQSLGFGTSAGVLLIDRLIPAGSREMSVQDYLRGRRL